jgi:hypothetical protein
MKRFPDILLLILALGTILACSFSATGWLRSSLKKDKQVTRSVTPASNLLRSGDLIFRDGKSFISHALKQFNRKDDRYSHAGIIHKEGDQTYVYHCIGGEGNENNKMMKEKLSSFCADTHVNAFAIYRPALEFDQLRLIDSLAGNYFNQGIEFDSKFNLEDSRRMYCTELIYKVFKEALGNDNFISLTNMAGVTYVSCDDIFLHSQMQELYSYSYQRAKQNNFHESLSN